MIFMKLYKIQVVECYKINLFYYLCQTFEKTKIFSIIN